MMQKKTRRGFTLIEVLVVVFIVAVLTAVAMPMYKRAVLKSRFSTVMPMAKSVANAQEVFFLGNGQYALSKADLDVAPMNVENTEVELSTAEEDENYNYVVAKRTDYPNVRYIVYQKNSPKFASNIHCEAADAEAEWLCKQGLGGQFIDGSVSGGNVKTYVLQGGGSDSFLPPCPANATCSSSTGAVTGCASGYCKKDGACVECDYAGSEICGYHAHCEQKTFGDNAQCLSTYGSCSGSTFSGDSICSNGVCLSTSDYGTTIFTDNATCRGNSANCKGAVFSGNAVCTSGAECINPPNYGGTTTFTDNASCTGGASCHGALFSGNASCVNAICGTDNYSGTTTFMDNASCSGNSSCSGAAFSDNASCTGNAGCTGAVFGGNSTCTSTKSMGCSNWQSASMMSTFKDNAVCAGNGCEYANYQDQACCSSCRVGSGKPKCGGGTW